MNIVVWREIIVAYDLIKDLIGNGESIRQATADELKRYYNRP